MPLFVTLSIVIVVLALGVVAWPLWRQTRGLAIGTVLVLGLCTFALYRVVGTPAALDPKNVAAPTNLADAMGQLQAELARNPNQPEGWALLGRSYASQAEYGKSRDAFLQGVKFAPDQPDLLVEAAQAVALANKSFDAQALALLDHALAVDPANQRGRWFKGVAQLQAGQNAEAAATWESLLGDVDPSMSASLLTQINHARAAGNLPLLAAVPPRAPKPDAAAAPALITVTVDLSPELRARLAADDSLFVFARAPQGPPMPLAARRVPAKDFPVTVTLGDGDGPMPTMKLSSAPAVSIVARVSKTGAANRAAGDFESEAQSVPTTAGTKAAVVIDRVAK